MKLPYEKVIELLGPEAKRVTVSHVADNAFSAEGVVSACLPAFTRIEILSHPGKGSNLRTEVLLPDEKVWNGRFVGTGNGGMAGWIRHDRMFEFLQKGYACANTDLGTSGGKACGYRNPDIQADFGWRGTHVMTQYAKTLIRAFYGKDPEYSYFVGASTGGQQAFSEAQRFPEDYDGICAGVPAFYRTAIHMYFCWNFVHLHEADGAPVFTEEEIGDVSRLAPVYFAARGGAQEGDTFVSLPWHGKDTAKSFVAWLGGQCLWMTEKKAEALKAVYEGPANASSGEKIYCGMPIGAELQNGGLRTFSEAECANFYPFLWAFGPEAKPADFDFAGDVRKMQELLGENMDALSTDLSAFSGHGGKFLSFSGSSDPWVPFPMSFFYAEKAAEAAGGVEELLRFFRYYLIPGRAHSGGPGATELYADESMAENVFGVLVRWVEDGVAPEGLTAAGNGVKRTVYPYGSKQFPFIFNR